MTWFAILVFGKVVFAVGPVDPRQCHWMIDNYVPPILDEMVIADGKIIKPEDYKPVCIRSPFMPALGDFDRGMPT